MIKIVCDLGGADKSPIELFKGVIDAVNDKKDLDVYVTVNEALIKESISKYTYDISRVHIINATDIITNNDNPTTIIREKKESTLVKGLQLLNSSDEYLGIVSIGSTGAVLVGSIMTLGRIDKCRPSLASMLINQNNEFFCLVDCGANVDCKSEHLVGFAKMGCAYMKAYCKINNPKVGLISNGVEEKKGNEVTKLTHQLLKETDLNFIGNIEGIKVLSGEADVIVCDGFDGNIILKNIEGTAKTIINDIYEQYNNSSNDEEKEAYKKLIKKLMMKYDFNSLGGAILLGVNKIVVKAHGAGTSETIKNTLLQAYTLAKNDLVNKIKEM